MKKRLALVAFAALLGLAGCGDDDGGTVTDLGGGGSGSASGSGSGSGSGSMAGSGSGSAPASPAE